MTIESKWRLAEPCEGLVLEAEEQGFGSGVSQKAFPILISYVSTRLGPVLADCYLL